MRYENGAVGQFEVSWSFRGGMDLRDEVAGTDGTIWLNHWLRTGMEMYTAVGETDYVAEKAEGTTGWLFPVGDEPGALGYVDMFTDMFDALDERRVTQGNFLRRLRRERDHRRGLRLDAKQTMAAGESTDLARPRRR